MNLETKKISLLEFILTINDEQIFDQITAYIQSINLSFSNSKKETELLNKYATKIESEFDLEKIKQKQGFKRITEKEIDALIEKADIQEPIETLLEQI